ncbi:hypothetical protein BUALT_Bualt03G0005500 [Buddleja alternifolia]|uniref:VQ domain-containing protein n=1 Tax=Buddleja alternifolia TaxID=168488 RepID=A0AAV6XWT6_9LAMI|nr:hypothetical protein BUALT_Bualt03G0005500 [Buddleja alternifolia]
MQNSYEWAQNYEENMSSSMEEFTFDGPLDATNYMGRRELSPKVSCSNNNSGGGLFPKAGGNNIGKPIKRRSRASKRAPTTLLNANTNNFRALVQQYTGYTHRASLANYKGPINLNFAQYNCSASQKYEAQQVHKYQKLEDDDRSLHKEVDQNFFPFIGTDHINIVASATTTTTGTGSSDPMFISTVNNNPRPDSLTLDDDEDFDVENFWQDLSGASENYSALPGTRINDDLWGY